MTKARFQKLIYDYYKKYGRHDLPWRKTTDPYKIMVSEIMLQQTQVDRVKEKYKTFIKKFPSAKSLAKASLNDVLKLWQGLGYNRRAINLKKAAEVITTEFKGTFPQEYELLLNLPGIGPYTANAIRAFAFNLPSTFIETNIRSVFIHIFFKDKKDIHDKDINPLIQKMQDEKNPRVWYWALMDYGSYLKREFGNANKASRHYTRQSKFEGSDRQIRGEILKYLLAQSKAITKQKLISSIDRPKEKIEQKIQELQNEGFIIKQKNHFMISK